MSWRRCLLPLMVSRSAQPVLVAETRARAPIANSDDEHARAGEGVDDYIQE